MQTTEFEGHSSEMRGDVPWLASEDIMGRGDVQVTIEHVFRQKDAEFEGGRKEDVYTLGFAGKKKQLVLNATNRKTLVNMFGPKTSDWIGQAVKLHVVKVQAFGELRHGIRIRKEDGNKRVSMKPQKSATCPKCGMPDPADPCESCAARGSAE